MSTQTILEPNTEQTLTLKIEDIKKPLSRILEIQELYKIGALSDSIDYSNREASNVIKLNAQKIESLIEEILEIEKAKLIKKKEPIIFEILREQDSLKESSSTITKPDKAWLKEIEKFVYSNISSPELKLSDIAFEVAVSERQLHRRINKLLGITPNKYVRKLRLHRAKKLIDSRAFNTTQEVSQNVGFQDAHYFKKVYQAEYPERQSA